MVQKLKAVGALAVVFLLVLATNKMDSNHFKVVKRSLSTIYKDRLVAQDYIYRLSINLQDKKLDLALEDKVNHHLNDSINHLVELYAETKLTTSEARYFKSFRNSLDELYSLEQNFEENPSLEYKQEIYQQHIALNQQLDELSKIQLKEGKRQIEISNRSISTSDLISNIEIGVLIVIGLIIQALIFFKPMR
ncbi:hypothetical protein GCM10009122_60930 [Fulvivirga kasyanovii]|uniref:Chemotaxis methyl-accepting receptor HlyB-like 4HB MCP domain-containing protein n=1 Tax=Fulvivirga kasyanovii TaxID=396812 RepID=A0ABW9RS18_9BACT|nr:hypothetical protein [Fulvivirga kasyanovii]MTI26969.1 hypothetical protein [Fulvivirga kasyanovii]